MAQRLNQQKIDEEVALGYNIKARQQHLLKDAIKHGRDPDRVLPHPDDIVVEEGVGYELTGPIDEAELWEVRRDCDIRDAAILQAALEDRLGPQPRPQGKEPLKYPEDASALLLTHLLNSALPKRFQKSDLQIAMDLMLYRGVTKRELLKRTHKRWATLGNQNQEAGVCLQSRQSDQRWIGFFPRWWRFILMSKMASCPWRRLPPS